MTSICLICVVVAADVVVIAYNLMMPIKMCSLSNFLNSELMKEFHAILHHLKKNNDAD